MAGNRGSNRVWVGCSSSDGILRGEGEGIVPRNNEAQRSDVYTLILNV